MSYSEFESQREHVIVGKHVQFHFIKVRDRHWLLEIPVPTLSKTIGYVPVFDYVFAQTTVTTIEAYNAYINLLDGGLE